MRNEEKLYSTKDLMEMFNISRFAITRSINSGKLFVTKKVGRQNFFSQQAIDDCMRSSKEMFQNVSK